MKLIRKFAVQGHSVPANVHGPLGPFPPEVLKEPQVDYGIDYSDSLHEALDSVRLFMCRQCNEVLQKDQLNNHTCEEE